jgi:hypothetical protein
VRWRALGTAALALLRLVVPLAYVVLLSAGAVTEPATSALTGLVLGIAGWLTTAGLLRYAEDDLPLPAPPAAAVVLAATPAACQGAGMLGPTGGALAVVLICGGTALTGHTLAAEPHRRTPDRRARPAPDAYRRLVAGLPTDLLVDEWRSLHRDPQDARAGVYLDVLSDELIARGRRGPAGAPRQDRAG